MFPFASCLALGITLFTNPVFSLAAEDTQVIKLEGFFITIINYNIIYV